MCAKSNEERNQKPCGECFILYSFVRSVPESICLRLFRTDLAPSSLGLYESLRPILSRKDLTLG